MVGIAGFGLETMRVAVAGAGGHAKVVADALLAVGEDEFVGFLDDDRSLWDSRLLGYPVRGPIAAWSTGVVDRIVVAVGDNGQRKRLFEQLVDSGATLMSVVHPRAVIGTDVRLGRGVVVLAGAIVNSGSSIGDDVILNTACSVDHDNDIGAHVHVAPGVHTAGNVRIGDGAFVGIGASVLPDVAIGEWAVVGAGAVVTHDVRGGATVVGVPAR
jgi:sugar O-acyltransferase (sialic acid O-acetyltransferase NeuD family)